MVLSQCPQCADLFKGLDLTSLDPPWPDPTFSQHIHSYMPKYQILLKNKVVYDIEFICLKQLVAFFLHNQFNTECQAIWSEICVNSYICEQIEVGLHIGQKSNHVVITTQIDRIFPFPLLFFSNIALYRIFFSQKSPKLHEYPILKLS